MPFRLNARNVFLTYPRCAVSPSALGEFLSEIRPATYIHVVRERHEDGTPHLHALLQWIDKYNLRDERKFDFEGFHPNIQPARDIVAIEDYISKALPDHPSIEDEYKFGAFSRSTAESKWRKVAEAVTEDDVLQAALDASARDYVIHHDRIKEYARSKQRLRVPYTPKPTETFQLPPALASYMITEFRNPVGLCPWILKEVHYIADAKNRIVLEPCCSSAEHVLVRPLGQEASDIIIIGGECPICTSSTQQKTTS